jgi:diguanylate cyclase (GGDEF)-like protein
MTAMGDFSDADELSRADRDRHKREAAGFWGVSLVLTLALLAVYQPTVALGGVAGPVFVVVTAIATCLYIGRLHRLGTRISDTELFIAALIAASLVAFDQWLAGGFAAPLYILFNLHVLGCSGVFTVRQRLWHVAFVSALVAVPLAYDRFDAQTVVFVLVFDAMLALEGALLADYGGRLRTQRHALHEAERYASALAVTDPLTGLGNRRALASELERVAAEADRDRPVTIVYLDLDGFKDYNDRLGHAAGDELLTRLGETLTERLAERGRGYRIGGDEFCVVLEHHAGGHGLLIEEIVAALTEQRPDAHIRPSHGVVVMPHEVVSADEALRLADARMYEQKASRAPVPAFPRPARRRAARALAAGGR